LGDSRRKKGMGGGCVGGWGGGVGGGGETSVWNQRNKSDDDVRVGRSPQYQEGNRKNKQKDSKAAEDVCCPNKKGSGT